MAVEADEASTAQDLALSDTDINWHMSVFIAAGQDKVSFDRIASFYGPVSLATSNTQRISKCLKQLELASQMEWQACFRISSRVYTLCLWKGFARGLWCKAFPEQCRAMEHLTVCKVINCEGFRGLYRGFGLTSVTQSPASALWWGAYGGAQHNIWRSMAYGEKVEKKPSHMEMVTVQATARIVAEACSSIFTTPVDTVKTRLQVMNDFGVGRPSVVKTRKALLQEDGWQGFYRGFG